MNNINNENRKICPKCGIERDEEKHFYLLHEKRMEICKDCLIDEIKETGIIDAVFKKYDIPLMNDLFHFCMENYGKAENSFRQYITKIVSLPQYKNLTWKDSDYYNEEEKDESSDFYSDIVKNLRNEAKKLNQKLEQTRNNADMNLYIATLKSLRETLDLISKYDWKLQYSEYQVKDNNGKWILQISIWEQNHDGQIRNHKIWKVDETEESMV